MPVRRQVQKGLKEAGSKVTELEVKVPEPESQGAEEGPGGSAGQPLLLTLDEGYLLTATLPDLQCGTAPLGPPVPVQPPLLGPGVAPPGLHPWPRAQGGPSRQFLRHGSLALSAAAPDLRGGVTLLGCHPSGMGSSRLLPLTSDVG